MPNEIKIKITTSRDPSGLKDARKDLDDLKKSAGESGKSLGEMEKASDEAGKSLGEMEKASDEAGKSLGEMEKASDKTGKSLGETGEASDRTSKSLGEMKKASAEVSGVLTDLDTKTKNATVSVGELGEATSKVREDLGKGFSGSNSKLKITDLFDPKPAAGFISNFVGNLGSAIAGSPKLIVAGAAIGAALAPALGASIAGAVVGVGGLAGIAGGLVLAAKDPRVKGAAADLGSTIMDDLKDRGKVFVEPALDAIAKLKDGYAEIGPEITRGLTAAGKFLGPFTDSFVKGGQNLIKGWADAMQDAGPVMEGLGTLVERVGERVGDMFREFAANEGAVDGMYALADTMDMVLSSTTGLLGGLASTFETIDAANTLIDVGIDKLEGLGIGIDLTADGYEAGTEAAKLWREGIIGSAGAVDDYDAYLAANRGTTEEWTGATDAATDAAKGQTDALAGLSAELKAQADPVFGLLKAQTDLGKAQSAADKAAKEYGENSPQYKKAIQDQAKAALDLTGKVGDLAEEFDGRLTPEMRSVMESAGMTKKEINALEKQFLGAYKQGKNFARTYAANVKVNGVKAARNSLYGIKDIIDEIPRAVNIHMRITGETNVSKAAAAIRKNYADGGIKGAAGGMVGGGQTWVGERGPELVDLPIGSTVRTAGDSMRMMRDGMRQAGQQATGGVLTAKVDPAAERTLIGMLINMLRFEINTQGGNVQTVLGRSY